MDNVDPLELLHLARAVAADAGALAMTMRRAGVSVAATKSSQLDIVTQADTAVEELIRNRLTAARPNDGFLGEEGGQHRGTSGITWIVDPIDGTVNYLYGSPYYAVSIAAAVQANDGFYTAVAGCVNAPELSKEYSAAAGHPAHCNGEVLHVNQDTPLERALVSTGIHYDLERRPRILQDINVLTPHVRDLRLVGAAALEICGVAEGRTDAHVQRGLPVWDYAAASLIAVQAGAEVRGKGIGDGAAMAEFLLVAQAPLARALESLLG